MVLFFLFLCTNDSIYFLIHLIFLFVWHFLLLYPQNFSSRTLIICNHCYHFCFLPLGSGWWFYPYSSAFKTLIKRNSSNNSFSKLKESIRRTSASIIKRLKTADYSESTIREGLECLASRLVSNKRDQELLKFEFLFLFYLLCMLYLLVCSTQITI